MEEEKDETIDPRRCQKFVTNHIEDCNKILLLLEEVHLILSRGKFMFGVKEVLIVGHM